MRDKDILEEAHELVDGPRQEDYGHPIDNFNKMAMMWSAILGKQVSEQEVALCMIATKIARETNRPRRDNRVDIAGYAKTLQMVEDVKEGIEEI